MVFGDSVIVIIYEGLNVNKNVYKKQYYQYFVPNGTNKKAFPANREGLI